MITKIKNEFRHITDREIPGDLSTGDLIREFGSLKATLCADHGHYGSRAVGHARLGIVVLELERRGLLD